MITKARCEEQGMTVEAGIFEETIQRFRTELTDVGLDPDAVVKERIRLLKKSLQ